MLTNISHILLVFSSQMSITCLCFSTTHQ
jgi:hypothetical protein